MQEARCRVASVGRGDSESGAIEGRVDGAHFGYVLEEGWREVWCGRSWTGGEKLLVLVEMGVLVLVVMEFLAQVRGGRNSAGETSAVQKPVVEFAS